MPCTLNYYLGWLMWCNVCVSYEPSYKTTLPRKLFAVRHSRPSGSASRKLCTNINQPYLIWAAVLCHACSSTKLGTNDAWTHNPIDQGVDNKKIYTVHDDLKLLRRWSPAGQLIFLLKLLLLVAVSTNTGLCDSSNSNCQTGDPRWDKIQLLRAAV